MGSERNQAEIKPPKKKKKNKLMLGRAMELGWSLALFPTRQRELEL